MGTNVDDEPALSRYLFEQTAAYLSEQVHLEVRAEPGIDVDSVLEQHVKNAKSGAVIAGSVFPIAQLPQSAEYLAYENTHADDGAVAAVANAPAHHGGQRG